MEGGNHPIHEAIKSHDLKELQRLLLEVQEQEDKDSILSMANGVNGDTLIHCAIRCNAPLDVLRLLLDYDCRFVWSRKKRHYSGDLPIHMILDLAPHRTAWGGDYTRVHDMLADALRILLEYDIDSSGVRYKTLTTKGDRGFNGMLPLHYAAFNNVSVEAIQVLLETDGRIGRETLLTLSNDGYLPLHYVFHGGLSSSTVAVVKTLLDHDVNNKSIFTEDSISQNLPLHEVCRMCGEYDNVAPTLIQLLLEKDTKKTTIHHPNAQLEVPILVAIQNNGSLQTIKLLLECSRKAKFTLFKEDRDNRETPIQLAFRNPSLSVEVIQFLLEHDIECTKAFLTIENVKGQLPIHSVCGYNRWGDFDDGEEFVDDWSVEVVKLLLLYSKHLEFQTFLHRDKDMKLPIDYIPNRSSSKTYKVMRDVLLKEKQRRVEVLDTTFKKYQCEKGSKDIIASILDYFGEDEFGLF